MTPELVLMHESIFTLHLNLELVLCRHTLWKCSCLALAGMATEQQSHAALPSKYGWDPQQAGAKLCACMKAGSRYASFPHPRCLHRAPGLPIEQQASGQCISVALKKNACALTGLHER